jgi:hypothetical protein
MLSTAHVLPHAPQFCSVDRAASHPLTTTPSQLSNPVKHALTAQTLFVQVTIPFVTGITVPQNQPEELPVELYISTPPLEQPGRDADFC